MKSLRILMFVALALAAGVARAEVYGYDEPAAEAMPEEVVVGDQGMPAGPMMGDCGCAPSWSNGCCERVASPADHIWDDYCCERHMGWGCGWGCGCGGRLFGGSGFQKDCCEPRCHLPRLHLPRLNCGGGKCTQKCAPVCAPKCAKSAKCGPRCGLLTNFHPLRNCGLLQGGLLHGGKCCKSSKCGKGGDASAMVIEAPAAQESNEIPMPMMPHSDTPPAPPAPDGRAA